LRSSYVVQPRNLSMTHPPAAQMDACRGRNLNLRMQRLLD